MQIVASQMSLPPSLFTWPYIHILINHFPVVLSTVGLAVAVLALILRRRGLWIYAMVTNAMAGIVVYPVRFTGDQADHSLNDPWYIQKGAIDAHDAASAWAMYFLLAVGVVSAYGWWRAVKRPEEPIPNWIKAAVLVLGLFGFATVARTAYLGGKIIHEAPVLTLPTPPANLPPGIANPPGPPGPPGG
jgi:uncharacterized membrane protein